MKAKIINYSNVNSEGVSLEFDKKVAMNSNLKSTEWRVSWDKIGDALLKQ